MWGALGVIIGGAAVFAFVKKSISILKGDSIHDRKRND
ncbi:hypothetical protein 031MP002_83 [Bacillus phage 031MP002]|nr:hypothetical protein 031MP002_83 [Bacillus phage 031MP002]